MSDILLLPELSLVFGVLGLLLCEAGFFGAKHRLLVPISVLALVAFLIQSMLFPLLGPSWLQVQFYTDWWGLSARVLLTLVAVCALLLEEPALLRASRRAEYYVMILAVVIGGSLFIQARYGVVQWVSLNLLLLSVFWVIGYDKTSKFSSESAFKFLLGSVLSSLLFLLFVVLTAGRSLSFFETRQQMALLVLWGASLSFLIGVVPLFWGFVDTVEGAPFGARLLLWVGLPVVGVAVLIRGLFQFDINDQTNEFFRDGLVLVGLMSIAFGVMQGISQEKIRRILSGLRIALSGVLILGVSRTSLVVPSAIISLHWVSSLSFMGLAVALDLFERSQGAPARVVDLKGQFRLRSTWSLLFVSLWASLVVAPPFLSGAQVALVMRRFIETGGVLVVTLWVALSVLLFIPVLRVALEMGKRFSDPVKVSRITLLGHGVRGHGLVMLLVVGAGIMAIPLSNLIDASGLAVLASLLR